MLEDGMRLKSTAAAVVGTLIVMSFALTASRGPQVTRTPGQMTEAHVWIENRGREEAIPVDVRDIHVDRPIRVHVVNGEAQYGTTNPAQVRVVRPAWEYRTVNILPTDDAAAKLNPLGLAGWETAGTVFASAEGTTVLLKRTR
jgi:beta-galactosidase GanA